LPVQQNGTILIKNTQSQCNYKISLVPIELLRGVLLVLEYTGINGCL